MPDVSASRPVPDEQTSALPAASEAEGETPDALANVSPETEPSTEGEPEAAPVKAKPVAKSATTQKAKPKIQGTMREIHPSTEGLSLRGFLPAPATVC